MNKAAVTIPVIIIVNACIWGLTMIMCSRALSGTGGYQEIQSTLAGMSAASLIVVGGGLGAMARAMKSEK